MSHNNRHKQKANITQGCMYILFSDLLKYFSKYFSHIRVAYQIVDYRGAEIDEPVNKSVQLGRRKGLGERSSS